MTQFSYHASQEQFTPSKLIDLVRQAEQAGFDAAFSSDHMNPWSPTQGNSGFAWAWLGAALASTEYLTFGAITVPGGWRYHPALLAQAIATLGEMYPGRLPWIAVGSGQALNEHVVGLPWPEKTERNARLREGAEIIRALLAGETVTHRGRHTVVEAKVWSRPRVPTRLVGAATSEATAEWLGGWADGLLTVLASADRLKRVIDAFRRGGGEGKPIYLKIDLSYANTEAEALKQAHDQWRYNILGGDANWSLMTPKEFEVSTRFVRPEDMRESVVISSDLGHLADCIAEYAALGFEAINLHNVGTNQAEFIDAFGSYVLPRLAGR